MNKQLARSAEGVAFRKDAKRREAIRLVLKRHLPGTFQSANTTDLVSAIVRAVNVADKVAEGATSEAALGTL